MNPRFSIAGFGMIQAMVGVVVVGILSLTFVRKTANRQELGITIRHVSYRDQVLDYYTSVANNRISWRNTKGAVTNWGGVGVGSGIKLVDVDATKTLIPIGGLLLTEQNIVDGNILPSPQRTCPPIPSGGKIATNHFCLKATKAGAEKVKISLDFQKEGRTVAEMSNYIIQPRSRDIDLGFGETLVGRNDCSKYGKAITRLDFNNKRITCSSRKLIEPPCYKWSSYLLPAYTAFCSRNGDGKCPDVSAAGGKTALVGFSNVSSRPYGNTRCSGASNVLFSRASLASFTGTNGIRSIDSQGSVRSIDATGDYIAVQPHTCPTGHATRGWDSATGAHISPNGCVLIEKGSRGRQGPRGFTGPRGQRNYVRGPRGDKGEIGDDGPRGDTGPPGYDGETGDGAYCCNLC